MQSKKWRFILSVFALLVCSSSACAGSVPDTGDPNERVCNPKSYTDLGNGIIKDNVTSLMWQQATAPGTYTWYQAVDYCNGLSLGGYSDWRLPTVQELSTLVDTSIPIPGPTIKTKFFPNTQSSEYSGYWSSTSYVSDTDIAWVVNFYLGNVCAWFARGGSPDEHVKTNNNYVRAVRGGSYGELGNWVINGNGTITDTSTGLMWQQDTAPGYGSGPNPDFYNWQQAVDYCNKLNLGGYSDWRLPTRNELQTLVDYGRQDPATTFPETKTWAYWSSTTGADYAGAAWFVYFEDGTVDGEDKAFFNNVRAVRGAPCDSSEKDPFTPCAATYLLGADDPRLAILRQFRDEKLAENPSGSRLIQMYYDKSPCIIDICEKSTAIKWIFKNMLEMIVSVIKVMM